MELILHHIESLIYFTAVSEITYLLFTILIYTDTENYLSLPVAQVDLQNKMLSLTLVHTSFRKNFKMFLILSKPLHSKLA